MTQPQLRYFYICREIGDHASWFLRGSWVARRSDAQQLRFTQVIPLVERLRRQSEGAEEYKIIEVENER